MWLRIFILNLKNISMSKERALKSKTFCSALWTAIFQNPDGKIAPCCVWQTNEQLTGLGNVNEKSISEIYKSSKVSSLKEKMLNGDEIKECYHCNEQVKNFGESGSRDFFNKEFFDKINWESDEPNFVYWDLRISNLCNFKCRMCGHGLSSEWYDDWKTIEGTHLPKVIKIDDKSNFWKQLEEHYPYVQSIYFAGGEPFLNEHHYTILEELVRRKLYDTRLLVNTNAAITHWRKKKVLDYYKPFNHVIFGFSIDGSYEVGEYIRKGLDYKKWKENVKEYIDYVKKKNTENITYLYQFAYGVTNLHNIVDFIIDLLNDGMITKTCHFNFQPIINPIEQSVLSIPPSVFNKFKQDVETLLPILKEKGLQQRTYEPIMIELNNIITYIENHPFEKIQLFRFYRNQEELDKLRNESIYDIMPDYRKLVFNYDDKKII